MLPLAERSIMSTEKYKDLDPLETGEWLDSLDPDSADLYETRDQMVRYIKGLKGH